MRALFTMVGSVLVGALVLLGIGGLTYHMFRDDGWVAQGLGAIWEAQYKAPMMTIILIIAALFVVKALHSAQIGGKRNSIIPDLVLFTFVATGIYFLGRLIANGEL